MTVVLVAILIGDGLAWLALRADDFYVFSPGTAPIITSSPSCRDGGGGNLTLPSGTPCARLDVPANLAHQIDGQLFMVDVYVGQATPLDYLRSELGPVGGLEEGTQLVPRGAVLGSTPQSQLGCQDTQQMQSSTSSAAVVAIRQLGYKVTENQLGAQLYQIQPGTAATAAGLRCGDVVTAIGGKPVHSSQDLVNLLHGYKPGDQVMLTANRPDGKGGNKTVTVTAHLTGTPAIDGHAANPQKAFLGVVAQDDTTFTFPFDVNIDVGDIGGPSAGLALTLGLLDVLSGGQLTGGHRIAATGTISIDGKVGDVGGVAQKAVAVRKAGAQVFFVPPQEFTAARSHAGAMKVYAVSTLTQALDDLKALGGHVPASSSGQNG
ncbi:MAG TPA: PDZ domain-containing protein [Acidimicrobiales bacterium]|nr:PDZ domain-containing protein [Acidimicrobiales bacterium]